MKICVTLLLLLAIPISAVEAPVDVEVELRRLTRENLDAVAPGRTEVWKRNLHEHVVHVDENGTVRNKTELLAELKPLPKGLVGRLQIAKFQVVVEGKVVIATHEDLEQLDYHGQMIVSRWRSTDTWLKTSAGWKLLGSRQWESSKIRLL